MNIAEAYYLGIPIIATHSGGADEFQKFFGGMKFTGMSAEKIAETIEDLFINDPRSYDELKSEIKPELVKQAYGKVGLLRLFDIWNRESVKI